MPDVFRVGLMNVQTAFPFTRALRNPNEIPTPSNPFVDRDHFGYAVSISQTYTAVGAHGFCESADGPFLSGRVYVFSTETGELLHTLSNPNSPAPGRDAFGMAVAVCESYLIVGAPGTENNGDLGGSGRAYIYNPATGTLLHTLVPPSLDSFSGNESFGRSVAICNEYAIVGAPGEGAPNGGRGGMGFVCTYSTATGTRLGLIPNPYLETEDPANAYMYFGWSVGISSTIAVVGSRRGWLVEYPYPSVWAYSPGTGALLRSIESPAASPTYYAYGESVAVSGNTILIGAPGLAISGQDTLPGTAYLFDHASGSWLNTFINPDYVATAARDDYAVAVSLSTSHVAIGHGGIGRLYVHDAIYGNLVRVLENPNTLGGSTSDAFAQSVSICEAGAVVGAEADGANGNDGVACMFSSNGMEAVRALFAVTEIFNYLGGNAKHCNEAMPR